MLGRKEESKESLREPVRDSNSKRRFARCNASREILRAVTHLINSHNPNVEAEKPRPASEASGFEDLCQADS
jgi:hypothetical protein